MIIHNPSAWMCLDLRNESILHFATRQQGYFPGIPDRAQLRALWTTYASPPMYSEVTKEDSLWRRNQPGSEECIDLA